MFIETALKNIALNTIMAEIGSNSIYDMYDKVISSFEILTMGDFGYLLSCLTMDMREKISREIGINLSRDTYRELIYKYVYTLKDLRNTIAHNAVLFILHSSNS